MTQARTAAGHANAAARDQSGVARHAAFAAGQAAVVAHVAAHELGAERLLKSLELCPGTKPGKAAPTSGTRRSGGQACSVA